MMFVFPYNFIAGAIALGLAVFGIHMRDAGIRAEGDKAGYARAEMEYVQLAAQAQTAIEKRAAALAATVDEQRAKDREDLHSAEADTDALEEQLAKGSGKECIAWSKETAVRLRR